MVALRKTTQQDTPQLNLIEMNMIFPNEQPHQLANGNWKISVVKGEAWVFCNDCDIIVNSGEEIEVTGDAPLIRPLYARTKLAYSLQSL